MVIKRKENIFCFYKKRGYKYEDELGLKDIQQPIPGNGARNACWYFLMQTERFRKRTELPL